jgi:hypothetical protein
LFFFAAFLLVILSSAPFSLFPAFSNNLNDATCSFSVIDFAVNGFNKVSCIISKTSASPSKKSINSATVENYLFTWTSISPQQSSSSCVYLDLTKNDSLNHILLVVSENVKNSSEGSHEFSLFGHSNVNSFSVFMSSISSRKWMKYDGNGNTLFEREITSFPSDFKESDNCLFVLSSDDQNLLLLDIRYGNVLSVIPLHSSSKQQFGKYHLFSSRGGGDVGLLSPSLEELNKIVCRSVDVPAVTSGFLCNFTSSSSDLPSSSFNHKLKLSENSTFIETFSKEIQEKIRNDIYYFIQKIYQEEYLLLEGKGKHGGDSYKQSKKNYKLKPFHSTIDNEVIQVRSLLM